MIEITIPERNISQDPIIFTAFGKLGRLPYFFIYDTETIQNRLDSGAIQYENEKPLISTIPSCRGKIMFHEVFIFPILLWTQYPQFLHKSLFPNLGKTIHDIMDLRVVSWKLPFRGLWVFYGRDCVDKAIQLLCEIDKKFIEKLKYKGKRKNNKTR